MLKFYNSHIHGIRTNRIDAQMKLGLIAVLMRQNGGIQTIQTLLFYRIYPPNGLNGDKCDREYFLSEVAWLLLLSHLMFDFEEAWRCS